MSPATRKRAAAPPEAAPETNSTVESAAAPANPPGGPGWDVDLLRSLCNAIGVSGDEGAVRRLVLEAIRPHVDAVRVDALGNVLAVKKSAARPSGRRARAAEPLRLLLAAHLDEVGLMVVDHDSDGSLRFELVGGVNERSLLGKPVLVGPRRLPGVIGAAPVHLLPAERKSSPVRAAQMRIDIGAGSQETARRQAPVGERAGYATELAVLEGALCGKALDDRLGCAALIEVLRGGPYPVELHAAFTVQEEVGLRGATVAGYAVEPHAAIALDCTPANDLPDSRGRENTQYNARLGAGPVIYVADNLTISDRRLVDFAARTAEQAGLPYQFRQPGGGGTDAGAIQRSRAGVPVLSVSTPARFLHGPAAIARTADWRAVVALIGAMVEGFGGKVLGA